MNIEELRTAYKQILDDCFESSSDFTDFVGPEHYDYVRKRTFPDCIHYSFGATKAVLWEDTLPYVIKIPLGFYRKKDYCEREVKNYKLAQNCPQITNCFAWCDFLFYYYDMPVYVMEKADCDEDEISGEAFETALLTSCEINNIKKDSKDYEAYCETFGDEWDWMEDTERMECLCRKQWGVEIVGLFEAFCIKNDINDLHTGNWGYVDGRLVVVDYSGF